VVIGVCSLQNTERFLRGWECFGKLGWDELGHVIWVLVTSERRGAGLVEIYVIQLKNIVRTTRATVTRNACP